MVPQHCLPERQLGESNSNAPPNPAPSQHSVQGGHFLGMAQAAPAAFMMKYPALNRLRPYSQVEKRSLRREQVQLEGKLPALPSTIVREQISIENELFETISHFGQPVRRNDHCIPMSNFIIFYE